MESTVSGSNIYFANGMPVVQSNDQPPPVGVGEPAPFDTAVDPVVNAAAGGDPVPTPVPNAEQTPTA